MESFFKDRINSTIKEKEKKKREDGKEEKTKRRNLSRVVLFH